MHYQSQRSINIKIHLNNRNKLCNEAADHLSEVQQQCFDKTCTSLQQQRKHFSTYYMMIESIDKAI